MKLIDHYRAVSYKSHVSASAKTRSHRSNKNLLKKQIL